jgi:DNA-binding NarL/FixJ family response regulator
VKALIADHHEIVRIGLKHLLSRWTVIEATDADTGLKLFKKHKPDVTILEVRIPGDGLACLTRIKLDCPDAPVLMLSGYDNPTYAARSVALGAQGYLSKTATAKEILAAIKTVAGGEAAWTRSSLRRITGSLMSTVDSDAHLTTRESEVIRQLALGLSNKEIGLALGISYETVKEHVQHILRKLGVRDRTQVAVWAVRKELV